MAMFERFSWESESDVSQVASQDAWELEDARPDESGDVGGFFLPLLWNSLETMVDVRDLYGLIIWIEYGFIMDLIWIYMDLNIIGNDWDHGVVLNIRKGWFFHSLLLKIAYLN